MYRTDCFIILVIICTHLKGFHADPCSSYTLISGQYKRSVAYTIKSTDIAVSDNFLSEGWYRFDSGAGNDMVTQAPAVTQCGTIYPIWMQGTLPSVTGSEVTRIACIVTFLEQCSKQLTIRVKHCGGYRVYYLVGPPQTSTGYCIGTESLCPAGQSSNTGFTPCQDLPAISINPYVNVSLEYSDTQGNKPLEPVFKCLFDEPDDNPYWYDTYWYINTDVVKLVASQPFMSNQSWLYPKDWVDMYDLNMVVQCSVRVRHFENSTPGHHNYSDYFQAGMFPSSFSYGVKEGETLLINLTVTVPVGCFGEDFLSHCKASIFILTPTYQSSASSCQNFSNQGEVSFDENNCGILIESSTWWEEKVLRVTGKTDGLINVRDRDVFIRLGTRTTETAEDLSGVWNNFTMPDIRIFLHDEEKKLENMICYADTDPRMQTFDKTSWTAFLAGEFVMYRDRRRQIYVHALFSSCRWSFWGGEGFCSCGIAVRVENSLFVYRTCQEISYSYSRLLVHHETVYHICDDRHMVVDIGNPWTKITLPNGAIVDYRVGENWLYNIHITPSIFDEDNVEGLCGNPNNDTYDDIIPQGSSFSTDNFTTFQASWRIDIDSTESLFGVNTTFNNSYFELQKYCDCAEEYQITNYSRPFSDFNAANCSITTEAITCSEKTTFQGFTSTCRRYQNRYKRDVNEMEFEHQIEKRSVDNDDIIEVAPLTLDPNFDPNYIPPTPSWKNGWNESTAREYCENIILNNQARISCQTYVPMEKSTDISLTQCMEDIRDSGTTEFSKYTLESLIKFCFDQIKKHEKYHIKRDTEETSVVDIIGKLVCPNDCSANGICNEGQCKCFSSYIGADCSLTKSTPPKNATLPESGLCKTSKRACAKSNIYGFFQSDVVYVKLEEFEITDLGRTNTLSTEIVVATPTSPTVLRIDFPAPSRKKRSSSGYTYGRGFLISLSYDEIHFSESMTVIIYNDACYSCSASTLTCNITSTCEESITKNNTDIQSTTVNGQNVNQVSEGSITPQSALPEENKEIPLALIISLCIISSIILGVVCVLLYLKLRPKTQLSPAINYIKNPPPECGQPPVQHYETLKNDRNISPPPDYDFLSPPGTDTFKTKLDNRPKTASSLVISFN